MISYRDAQCDFLSGLGRNQKDKSKQIEKSLDIPRPSQFQILQCQDVDQNCRLDVVEEKEFWSSPNQEIIPEITREILSDIFPIVR